MNLTCLYSPVLYGVFCHTFSRNINAPCIITFISIHCCRLPSRITIFRLHPEAIDCKSNSEVAIIGSLRVDIRFHKCYRFVSKQRHFLWCQVRRVEVVGVRDVTLPFRVRSRLNARLGCPLTPQTSSCLYSYTTSFTCTWCHRGPNLPWWAFPLHYCWVR
jgi:hypothetical protein